MRYVVSPYPATTLNDELRFGRDNIACKYLPHQLAASH
jgi:hypothetical protein